MLIIDSQPFFMEDHETVLRDNIFRINRKQTDLEEFTQ